MQHMKLSNMKMNLPLIPCITLSASISQINKELDVAIANTT